MSLTSIWFDSGSGDPIDRISRLLWGKHSLFLDGIVHYSWMVFMDDYDDFLDLKLSINTLLNIYHWFCRAKSNEDKTKHSFVRNLIVQIFKVHSFSYAIYSCCFSFARGFSLESLKISYSLLRYHVNSV